MPATQEAHFHVQFVIERPDLQQLFTALQARGYQTVGPTLRDGAILYAELDSVDDLPAGWTDIQEGGAYRVARRDDDALFGYVVGPNAWKQFLFPPLKRLWRARRTDDGFVIEEDAHETPHYAFVGVRACDLHAIQLQDRVYLGAQYVDADYRERRTHSFVVAVNCTQAGGACFCASMQTGPKVAAGFDLALTEVLADGEHYFVVEVGTEQGAAVLMDVPHRPATEPETALAAEIVAETARHMGRTLDTTGLRDLLYRSFEHPQWEDVAERCLTCGNCTLVCPTCFCHTIEDTTDLSGCVAERWRTSDSCFNIAFSFISSGSVRTSAKSRYRQWLTHKLAAWQDQYGDFGCVGCGRCITWCPVGIDLTQEAAALRASEVGMAQAEAMRQPA